MGMVKCFKMKRADYAALSVKNDETLYFVNDNGDFGNENLETDGDIYIGDKLLTEKSTQKPPAYYPGNNISIDEIDPKGEYQMLESVYNAPSTRIDTGINTFNDDVEFYIRFRQTSRVYMRLFGADTGGSSRYRIGFIALNYNDITLQCRDASGLLISDITRTTGHVYTLKGKLKDGIITLFVKDETTGETDLKAGTYTVDTGYAPEIRLFYLISGSGSYQASGTHVYQAAMKVRGKIVMNYVPAKKKSDNEVGFLDTVTNTFKGASNGTWNAGNLTDGDAYIVSGIPAFTHDTADLTTENGVEGHDGLVPHPTYAERGKFLRGDGTWQEIDVFTTGGDEQPPNPGRDGLVPSPTYGQRTKFLRGDGTWQDPPAPSVMSGATSQAAGSAGLVPQPLAGDNDKYLSGDGTFKYPAAMFGRCTTGASTKAKTVTVSGPFQLVDGAVVFVRFANSNTASSPTLNVNSTGAKSILRYGSTAPGTGTSSSWQAGTTWCMVYDGDNDKWMMVGWINTTYSTATQSSNGLMSTSDKTKLDHLPSSVVQPIRHFVNADWVPYGTLGYQNGASISFSSSDLAIDDSAYQSGDCIDISANLSLGNTSAIPVYVLFTIEKWREKDGSSELIATLASTLVTVPEVGTGKCNTTEAFLRVLYQVSAEDFPEGGQCSFKIVAKEIDDHAVRFFNSVDDDGVTLRPHASTYTLNAWRGVSL